MLVVFEGGGVPVFPHGGGKGSALNPAAQVFWLIVADIKSGHEIGGAADEPGVFGAGGGARFAHDGDAEGAKGDGGAALDDAFEHVGDLIGGLGVHGLSPCVCRARHALALPCGRVAAIAGARVGTVNRFAIAIGDEVEKDGIYGFAAVDQDGIGVDEFGGGGFASA